MLLEVLCSGRSANGYGTDWSADRVLAHGAAGGLMAKLQGGNVFEGVGLSAASALAMMGWQAMRDSTDASSQRSRPDAEIRKNPIDGERDTIGARLCSGNCDRFFDIDSIEGQFNTSVFNSEIGRAINLVSKPHDFANSWNYDESGFSIGHGAPLNLAFDIYSYTMMPVAGIYTAFAFSATAYQPLIYR